MARVTDTFPAAGLLAARPADPGVVPAFYSATDTNLIYRWDGTTWGTWAILNNLDAEVVRDTIAAALVAGTNVTLTVDDPGDTITIDAAIDPEVVRDTIGAALVAGTNVTLTVDDVGDTITINAAGATTDPEVVRDTMATALVAGANVTLTVDDVADTITIAATGGSGGGTGGLWKGAWTSAPDELLYSKDFSDDLTPWTGAGVQTTMAAAIGSNDPAFTHADQAYFGTSSSGGDAAKLTFADIPALVGRTITRAKLWVAGQGNNTGVTTSTFTYRIMSNGVEKWVQSLTTPNANPGTVNLGWTEVEVTNLLTDLTATVAKTASFREARMAITGVRVYGAIVGWTGYQTDEYVVHNGLLWVSNINNNMGQPGVDAGWTQKVLTPDPEQVRDTVAAALVAGTNVTLTVNDVGDTITINSTTDAEVVRDTMAAALIAGTGVTLTVDDAANTITINSVTDAEVVRDTMATALVAGANITLAVDDAANTITVNSEGGSPTAGVHVGQTVGQAVPNGGADLDLGVILRADPGFTVDLTADTITVTEEGWYAADAQAYLTAVNAGEWYVSIPAMSINGEWFGADRQLGVASGVAYLAAGTQVKLRLTNWTGTDRTTYTDGNGANTYIKLVRIGGSPAPTRTINAQTGTAYTLALTDAGDFVTMTNAAASTLTVPPNSSVAFPVGAFIEGAQLGAGQVTITPGAGVTINATPGLKTAAQYATFGLLKTATDTWLAYGRLAA